MIKPCPHLQALKEKTELQAELAALDACLRAQCEETRLSSERQASLASEVSSLRSERGGLERAIAELQGQLEEKNTGLESLSKDLQLAEQQYQRLMGRVEDMQQSLSSRDTTGEEAKNMLMIAIPNRGEKGRGRICKYTSQFWSPDKFLH